MFILNDYSDFKLLCVKSHDSIEFKASRNGNLIEGILSRGIHFNWIAFPSLGISCQLSDFSDTFWNTEQLDSIFNNPFDVDTALLIIYNLKQIFEIINNY